MADRQLVQFDRGGNDVMRVALREHKGSKYVDMRVWFRKPDGSYQATSKGVTVRRAEILAVQSALDAALAELEGRPVAERDPTEAWGK